MYYIGLDAHQSTLSYCVKDANGQIQGQGRIQATGAELDSWMKTLPQPWTAAIEATVSTGWIYDHLLPHAAQVKVGHPLMLLAIAAAKKNNDRLDASDIADCLRDILPGYRAIARVEKFEVKESHRGRPPQPEEVCPMQGHQTLFIF
jgi:hypothetical protein